MIYAIHGFCGLSSDWDFVRDSLGVDVHAEDLWQNFSGCSMRDWAERKARELRGDEPRILLGYSLGARLAMHLLLADPSLWRAAIFVSGHPGLSEWNERDARLAHDHTWATRFRTMPWEDLMATWENQQVFDGSLSPSRRREQQFSREILAQAIVTWSLGRQDNLRPLLSVVGVPQLWLAGSHDTKYVRLLSDFAPNFEVVADAGHRVPWDQSTAFLETIARFISRATPRLPESKDAF